MSDLIPSGTYCYSEKGRCPFWRILKTRPHQENGYCLYLHQGDFSDGLGLLWDQCKECGVNDDYGDGDDLVVIAELDDDFRPIPSDKPT